MRQEYVRRVAAPVIRGDVLRLSGIPFITRVPGLPELPRGQQLELDILGGDEVALTLEARVHRVMDAAMAAEVEGLEEELIDEPTSVDRVEPSLGPETPPASAA